MCLCTMLELVACHCRIASFQLAILRGLNDCNWFARSRTQFQLPMSTTESERELNLMANEHILPPKSWSNKNVSDLCVLRLTVSTNEQIDNLQFIDFFFWLVGDAADHSSISKICITTKSDWIFDLLWTFDFFSYLPAGIASNSLANWHKNVNHTFTQPTVTLLYCMRTFWCKNCQSHNSRT